MTPIDLNATNPMRTLNADQPEALFAAAQALAQWDAHTLRWTDAILTEWITDALANPKDWEGWAELHGLIQRLQVIQPVKDQPDTLQATVEAYYYCWDGMANLLAARAHREDQHDPQEIEKRTHMAELKAILDRNGSEIATRELQNTLQLSPSRLSQLLSLAEAAGLITRRKQGRERLVSPSGIWQASTESHNTPASTFVSFNFGSDLTALERSLAPTIAELKEAA